uniref:EGF-like domain-containing protein n=1 Tax=Brassica oleracea TaxID=3712 RepID=A0A3P6GCV7_BRAOL|nr:unnamed protein product [Brassica oleracea]
MDLVSGSGFVASGFVVSGYLDFGHPCRYYTTCGYPRSFTSNLPEDSYLRFPISYFWFVFLFSTLFTPNNICKAVVCGKGKCKASSNGTFKYECTFDLSCGEAGPPAQPPTPPKDNNASFFDVCHWMNCGEGICKKKNLFLYSCECREGYSNFMNIATSPCFKQCALGQDCLNPGTPSNSSSNASSSSPPALPDGSKSQATGPNLRGSSLWLISSMICVSLAPWRLLCI